MKRCSNPDCGFITDDDNVEFCPKKINPTLKCNHQMIKQNTTSRCEGIRGIHRISKNKSSIFHQK